VILETGFFCRKSAATTLVFVANQWQQALIFVANQWQQALIFVANQRQQASFLSQISGNKPYH